MKSSISKSKKFAKKYFVYILRCNDGTLYTGITNDIEKRVYAHNSLKSGAKYTHARRPVSLIYSKNFRSKGAALKREHTIKKMTRFEKQKLVASAAR